MIPSCKNVPLSAGEGSCTAGSLDVNRRRYESVYGANTGNDLGISTVGYRSSRYNCSEWYSSQCAKNKAAQSAVDHSEKLRSTIDVKEGINRTDQLQNTTTKKLCERLRDIGFWKDELRREIRDLSDETVSLICAKRKLECSLNATELVLHIATDNLNCRERREGVDLTQDNVELNLLKEVEVVNNARDLLKRTIEQVDDQVKRNRDCKRELEMDWSHKKEADKIDSFCANLSRDKTCKQYYAGAAKFQEMQSTPESWAQHTHDNIVRAEHERMASMQLRDLVESILEDVSRDIREQADAVEQAFRSRIDELPRSKQQLEDSLCSVVDNITKMERTINDLKEAIKEQENAIKVAETRLKLREYRPNVELCRDPPQYHLVGDVQQISCITDSLIQKLSQAEDSLKDLQDQRMLLEKDIGIKSNSLFIDREKCLTRRTRFPSASQLQGMQC